VSSPLMSLTLVKDSKEKLSPVSLTMVKDSKETLSPVSLKGVPATGEFDSPLLPFLATKLYITQQTLRTRKVVIWEDEEKKIPSGQKSLDTVQKCTAIHERSNPRKGCIGHSRIYHGTKVNKKDRAFLICRWN
jgi:hypothetical protein